MLSATLEAGLSDYAIGAKIRALRLKKKMGLVELGQHSGLSPALLSKLERGACSRRCRRCCGSRSSSASASTISSPARARSRSWRWSARRSAYSCQSVRMGRTCLIASSRWTTRRPSGGSTHYAEFLPVARDNVRLHTHAGVEFIYTLKGRLNVHIDGQEHALESGDSMASTPAFPMGTAAAAPQHAAPSW